MRPSARLVVANCEDTANTNITLTVRQVAPHVHIAAVVEEEDSIDILQLSGATSVLPLKRQQLTADTVLPEGGKLGSAGQRKTFAEAFEHAVR